MQRDCGYSTVIPNFETRPETSAEEQSSLSAPSSLASLASSASPVSPSSSPYRFPPGLKLNLPFYVFRKFRPADPIGLFEYLAKEYGDAVHYKIGRQHILFLNDPAYMREILVVQNDNFTKERTVRRTKLLLGEGMITSEGNSHRAQRQVAQPAFHRQRIGQYAETMVAETLRLQQPWSDGQQLDLSQEMMHLTLRIVARTLFNTELGAEVEELADAINQIMGLYNYLVALPAVEVLIHLRVPGLSRFTKAKRTVDSIVYRMIDNHRRAKTDSGDLLDMMLRASPSSTNPKDLATATDALRDQVITIFLAGYETVANALTWTWYLLSQNPEAEQQMFQEVSTVLGGRTPTMDDVPQLRYVEMVFAEAMRLYPPAWAMGRQARHDFEVGPYRLPAGTTVLMSQFVAHRDPRRFTDPLRFDPDRFAPAGRSTFPKFSYFPFGAGFRQCIGESLSWMEGVLVLSTIAQQWKLHLASGHRVETQALITLRPKYGMQMTLEKRI
jgi:cytochrome P450